jgi:hypothetical protein
MSRARAKGHSAIVDLLANGAVFGDNDGYEEGVEEDDHDDDDFDDDDDDG